MSGERFDYGLPINSADLINLRTVECHRVEFKATWDKYIKPAVVKTVSALANDLLNLNGGYIVLGIEEKEGRPKLPPRGLDDLDLDKVQREIRAVCQRIKTDYIPIVVPVVYEDKSVIIIWAPGGDNRPYQAPEDVNKKGSPFHYYVRLGSETVKATGEVLRQLFEAAAKIPFDDRRNLKAKLEDISSILVKRFLNDIGSDLLSETDKLPDNEIYSKLRLTAPLDSTEVPRNVALIFFNEDPDAFFPGARIEIVQFGDDAGGDLIEERVFKGPVHNLIKSALDYLDSIGGTLIQKVRGQAEVERTVPYPYEAMEEAIVNAIYHRGYDNPPEPVKIYLYPDRMEVINYPGPVIGINNEHFEPGRSIPPVPARNRRIGEILKELRLAEGRGTGIPKIHRKMRENGSPEASFFFDDDRTYFQVILPVHPRYQVLHGLREAGHLWAVGDKNGAINHLLRNYENQPQSGALASQIIEYAFANEDIELAHSIFETFEKETIKTENTRPYLTFARLLIDRGKVEDARSIIKNIPSPSTVGDIVEEAIIRKRSGDHRGAHNLLEKAFSIDADDPKIVHELATTKLELAKKLWRRKDVTTKKRLNREAAELLRRAIQLTDDVVRKAWCWFNLAKTLAWLRAPRSEVEEAYLKARSLMPDETRFSESYERWRSKTFK